MNSEHLSRSAVRHAPRSGSLGMAARRRRDNFRSARPIAQALPWILASVALAYYIDEWSLWPWQWLPVAMPPGMAPNSIPPPGPKATDHLDRIAESLWERTALLANSRLTSDETIEEHLREMEELVRAGRTSELTRRNLATGIALVRRSRMIDKRFGDGLTGAERQLKLQAVSGEQRVAAEREYASKLAAFSREWEKQFASSLAAQMPLGMTDGHHNPATLRSPRGGMGEDGLPHESGRESDAEDTADAMQFR